MRTAILPLCALRYLDLRGVSDVLCRTCCCCESGDDDDDDEVCCHIVLFDVDAMANVFEGHAKLGEWRAAVSVSRENK